jgi:hypothetical protein
MHQVLQLLHRHEATRPQLAVDKHLLYPLVRELDLVDQAARRRRCLRTSVPVVSYEPRPPVRELSHEIDDLRCADEFA